MSIQPEGALENLEMTEENPPKQVGQACRDKPKKTLGCDFWQRCFNGVLTRECDELAFMH